MAINPTPSQKSQMRAHNRLHISWSRTGQVAQDVAGTCGLWQRQEKGEAPETGAGCATARDALATSGMQHWYRLQTVPGKESRQKRGVGQEQEVERQQQQQQMRKARHARNRDLGLHANDAMDWVPISGAHRWHFHASLRFVWRWLALQKSTVRRCVVVVVFVARCRARFSEAVTNSRSRGRLIACGDTAPLLETARRKIESVFVLTTALELPSSATNRARAGVSTKLQKPTTAKNG